MQPEVSQEDKEPKKRSPLKALGTDAGCLLVTFLLAVCIAAISIFFAAASAGSPWAGAAAVAALAAMGLGTCYVMLNRRA